MTALGTAIEERVIKPFVVQPAQQHMLSKPVLVRTPARLRLQHPAGCLYPTAILAPLCRCHESDVSRFRNLACCVTSLQLITITDGEPTNEPEHKIFQVIKRSKDYMAQTPYGPKAIAFEFAQACDITSAYACVSATPCSARAVLWFMPGRVSPLTNDMKLCSCATIRHRSACFTMGTWEACGSWHMAITLQRGGHHPST